MHRPLTMVVPEITDGAAIFSVASREIRVETDLSKLQAVVQLCNGLRTLDEIADQSGVPVDETREILVALEEHLIVLDATEAYRIFNRYSAADSPFFHELTEDQIVQITLSPNWQPEAALRRVTVEATPTTIGRLCGNRSSSDSTAPIHVSAKDLFAVLTAMCGRAVHRPVPSAGGLYPLCLHIVVQESCPPLESGIWWFDSREESLCLLKSKEVDLKAAFFRDEVTEKLLANSTAVVFISVDFDRMSRKYANRGYRYGLMEAGASMQNAYLVAAESKLPIRAIGGFDDRAIQSLLGNDGELWPVLCLTLGG